MCVLESGYRAVHPKFFAFKVFFEKVNNIKKKYPKCSLRIRNEMVGCLDPNTALKNTPECQPESIVGLALEQTEDVNVYFVQGLCYVIRFKEILLDILIKADCFSYFCLDFIKSKRGQKESDPSNNEQIQSQEDRSLKLSIIRYTSMIRNEELDDVTDLIKTTILSKFVSNDAVDKRTMKFIIKHLSEKVTEATSDNSQENEGIN
ncbi:hypothetical protein RF11_11392 [Thelohanellus kitauei]|uniref:Uncharacterized protein n=1 Tax=Thelohanellus kitauei TaxID=669202 RepID=A0A0C2JA88_THEKT|nr:hypothetical protein RF11_11392 [Thelohanellus kitauei]